MPPQVGDQLLQVDGRVVQNKSLTALRQMIKGPSVIFLLPFEPIPGY